MPRPRTFDTEAVTLAIRDAFWRGGYAGTTMQDLVQATGVRAGSLHAVFGDKDALFAQAFTAYGEHFQRCMETGASGANAIRLYIRFLAEAVIADDERKGCLIVQAALEQDDHTPETRLAAEARLADMRAFFDARLHEERCKDAKLSALLFGTTIAILTLGRTQTPPDIIRNMAEGVLRALPSPAETSS